MGDIADMMLDGTLDCVTGEYLGEGDGYPRTRERGHGWSDVFPKGTHGGRKPRDTKCPDCGKMMRGEEGLRTHAKAVHQPIK